MDWVHHYLWTDLYVPVWPNIAASAILGVWALRRFIRLEELHKRNHKEIKDAIRNPQERGK